MSPTFHGRLPLTIAIVALVVAIAGCWYGITVPSAKVEPSSPYLHCDVARILLHHSRAVRCYHPAGNPSRVVLWHPSWLGRDRGAVYYDRGWKVRVCHCSGR